MKHLAVVFSMAALLVIAGGCSQPPDYKPELATPGKATLVEFGSLTCTPCKMMEKVLDEMREKFPERLDIVFVNVKDHPDLAKGYGVRMIPTQILFDATGKQVLHHIGFIDTEQLSQNVTPYLSNKRNKQ